MARKKKMPTGKLCKLVVFGTYYKAGRMYKQGDDIVWPVNVKPSAVFKNTDNTRIAWVETEAAVRDEKTNRITKLAEGYIANAEPCGAPQPTVSEISNEIQQLAAKHSEGELQEMCAGLNLDPNGTRAELAAKLIEYEKTSKEEVTGESFVETPAAT